MHFSVFNSNIHFLDCTRVVFQTVGKPIVATCTCSFSILFSQHPQPSSVFVSVFTADMLLLFPLCVYWAKILLSKLQRVFTQQIKADYVELEWLSDNDYIHSTMSVQNRTSRLVLLWGSHTRVNFPFENWTCDPSCHTRAFTSLYLKPVYTGILWNESYVQSFTPRVCLMQSSHLVTPSEMNV